ncbi:NAD-dependent epimerase/dehydratase family protein [Pseudomonas sp. NPDC077382]
MRVLLTGASGFLGRRLATKLAVDGHEILALIRAPIDIPNVEQLIIPRLDADTLARVLDGQRFDAAVNVAAAGVRPDDRDVIDLNEVNASLPWRLVKQASERGARAFVHIGSSAEYLPSTLDGLLTEDSPLESRKLYGATKAAGTLLASAAGRALDLPVACLRLFNIFGPGEAGHRLFPSLVSRLGRHERVPLSEGSQVRDFMHVDDACSAIVTALLCLGNNPALAGIYNIASGEGTSVKQFASEVAHCVGDRAALLDFGAIPFRPDDLPFVVGNPSAFRHSFGWSPSMDVRHAVEAAVADVLARNRTIKQG